MNTLNIFNHHWKLIKTIKNEHLKQSLDKWRDFENKILNEENKRVLISKFISETENIIRDLVIDPP